MLQRFVVLMLIGFVASGFSWGSSDAKEEESADKKNAYYGSTSSSYNTDRPAQSSAQKKAAPARTSKAASAKASQTAQVNASQKFPVQLISNLASGDEETRKARLESLKRLSHAMSQMNSRQAAAEAKR